MTDLVKVQPVSGYPEWLPGQRLVEERFLQIIRQTYQLYGFTPIETPAVERMEVLLAKGNMGRQIYTLGRPPEEGEGGEPGKIAETGLGLHFDLTVPLARYVVQYADKLTFPFRRYQIQKVWRGERAQRGRFREFYQCDIDVVGRGALDPIHDAEIPCVINAVFTNLGLPDFRVRMSNRKVLRDLLLVSEGGGRREEGEEKSGDQLTRVLRAIDKSEGTGLEKTRATLEKEGVEPELVPAILDLIQCPTIADARKIFTTAGAPQDGLNELDRVMQSAVTLGMPEGRMAVDFKIARGLDYYTGTIYETHVLGNEKWGSICSGGRYDDLCGFFSKQQYPGVGISIGLSRLFDLLVNAGHVDVSRFAPTQVLVTTQDRDKYLTEYLALARTLREAGIRTEVYFEPKPLRDQFGYASSCGVTLALIVGERELEQGGVMVKDLVARTQELVPRGQVAAYVRGKLGSGG